MSSKIKSDFRKLEGFEICILQEILKKHIGSKQGISSSNGVLAKTGWQIDYA